MSNYYKKYLKYKIKYLNFKIDIYGGGNKIPKLGMPIDELKKLAWIDKNLELKEENAIKSKKPQIKKIPTMKPQIKQIPTMNQQIKQMPTMNSLSASKLKEIVWSRQKQDKDQVQKQYKDQVQKPDKDQVQNPEFIYRENTNASNEYTIQYSSDNTQKKLEQIPIPNIKMETYYKLINSNLAQIIGIYVGKDNNIYKFSQDGIITCYNMETKTFFKGDDKITDDKKCDEIKIFYH